jgi:hypothetical protein
LEEWANLRKSLEGSQEAPKDAKEKPQGRTVGILLCSSCGRLVGESGTIHRFGNGYLCTPCINKHPDKDFYLKISHLSRKDRRKYEKAMRKVVKGL